MSGKTPYQAAQELNAMRGVAMAAWTPYLGLAEQDPAAAPSTEFDDTTAPGYTRVVLTFNLPTANQSVVGVSTQFPNPAGDWPVCNYIGIWDDPVVGTLRYSWPLTTPVADRTASNGKPFQVPVGSIVIRHT